MATEDLKVYMTSVSSKSDIRKQQQHIFSVLDSKGVEYSKVDIAANEEDKLKMREVCANERALPPKIIRGDHLLGDYEAFDEAVENAELNQFLRI